MTLRRLLYLFFLVIGHDESSGKVTPTIELWEILDNVGWYDLSLSHYLKTILSSIYSPKIWLLELKYLRFDWSKVI